MSSDAELESLYRDVVLAHYREPRHREPLVAPDGRGRAVNPTCGDAVDVEVRLREGRIDAVSARALGCSIAVASGSVLAELVRGCAPQDATRLSGELARIVAGGEADPATDARLRAFAPLARLPARQRCALLAWEALAAALADAAR